MAISNIIEPIGKIWLCAGVPLTPSYSHSLYFDKTTDQNNYFASKKITNGEITNQNYVKSEQGKIRVSKEGLDNNDVMDVNYMMYENASIKHGSSQSTKPERVFAFITDISLVSPNVFEITYEVDVLQTYALFHANFGQCIIERRNVNKAADDVGQQLEPEPVKFGNQVLQNLEVQDAYTSTYTSWRPCVFGSVYQNQLRDHGEHKAIEGLKAGIFQGLLCTVYRSFDAFRQAMQDLSSQADEYDRWLNSIQSIIAIPPEFAHGGFVDGRDFGPLLDDSEYNGHVEFTKRTSGKLGATVNLMGHADVSDVGYTPTNKKLYTYPYNVMHITNNDGQQLDLRYEYFDQVADGGDIQFNYIAAIQPNFEIVFFPINYGGNTQELDLGIRIAQMPLVPYFSDSYTQWLGTSKMSYYLSGINSFTPDKMVGSIMGGGMFNNTPYTTIANYLSSQHDASIAPDSFSSGSGTAKMLVNGNTLKVYQKCVNELDAKRIDDFFTEFGYAINKIGSVNFVNSKWYHHYIKTTGCVVKGRCPASFARKIEDILNSGITWWDMTTQDGINNIGKYRDDQGDYITK